MNVGQIEIAVASYFDIRQNIIVPNISWGLGLHECDLLVVTTSHCAIEIEIKTSKADIIADKKKWHNHYSKKLRSLIFAIPEKLQNCIHLIPEKAGVMVVKSYPTNHKLYCTMIRKAQINKDARKLTDKEILHLAKLGTIRTWKLRRTIQDLRKRMGKP